jgi:RNA polymerase sigma factor (sigma-70 family)
MRLSPFIGYDHVSDLTRLEKPWYPFPTKLGLHSRIKETQEIGDKKDMQIELLSTLVLAAQQGDAEAFDDIVGRFQDMAYAGAYALVEDRQLAEDVAQEAFIEAYLSLPKLREPAAFPGWFRRILFKQGDRLTRGKRFVAVPLETAYDLPLNDAAPPEIVESREVQEQVRRAVEALPEHERIVVALFYGTGYPIKEIAAFLEVPVTTVKKRLHDARKRLREQLGQLGDEMRQSLHEQCLAPVAHFPEKVRLLIAARTGNIAEVKRLLERNLYLINTNVNSQEYKANVYPGVVPGYTALHEAAMNGDLALVRLLLNFGANPNARTGGGITPLHLAVQIHQHAIITMLLAHGANANAALSNGQTSLHWAAMRGDGESANILLAYGASVNALSQHHRTPLHWAALKGHTNIVHLLLAAGADSAIHDESGCTPLDWAIAREHLMITHSLEKCRQGDEKCQQGDGKHRPYPQQVASQWK